MPKQYPKQQRDRAVRMVLDHLAEYVSTYLACKTIGPKVGVESCRRWVVEAQSAGPGREPSPTGERARTRELEREVRDLQERPMKS